jgi:hypothetical protein
MPHPVVLASTLQLLKLGVWTGNGAAEQSPELYLWKFRLRYRPKNRQVSNSALRHTVSHSYRKCVCVTVRTKRTGARDRISTPGPCRTRARVHTNDGLVVFFFSIAGLFRCLEELSASIFRVTDSCSPVDWILSLWSWRLQVSPDVKKKRYTYTL